MVGHSLTFVNDLSKGLIESHDVLILGGGNILDFHYTKLINRYKASLKNKLVYGFSLGFTDDKLNFDDLKVFNKIWVRDLVSLDKLRKGLGGVSNSKCNCAYCPDAAVILDGDKERGRGLWQGIFSSLGRDLYERRIAVVVNAHLISGFGDKLSRDFLRFQLFSQDLGMVVDETMASFLFVPFGVSYPWDDRVSNGWVGSHCKWFKKNGEIFDKLCVQDTLDLISGSDLVLSTRYHSSVFSLTSLVPFIDIWHHDKNGNYLKSIDLLEECGISYWNFSKEKLTSLLNEKIRVTITTTNNDNGDERRKKKLLGIRSLQRGQLMLVVKELLKLTTKGN